MPLITETYYLSLTQDNRGILRLRCSQDDTLRTVNLKLYNNGSIFAIPNGVSASISGVKQNGAVFSKPCTISQDRESVVLQLSSDITNIDGIIIAEIVLNDGEGGRLGTSNFIIQVEKNPIRAGVVQDTETPIEYINDFITQIQALTARLNNLITPSGDPSLAEVVDARISSLDSNTYQNLKARIDADIATLNTGKANKSEVYTKSQVDGLLENIEIDVDDEFSDESENPVQNKVINREISEIKADLANLEPGLSNEAKAALMACFRNAAWVNENGIDYYVDLADALDFTMSKVIRVLNRKAIGTASVYNDEAVKIGTLAGVLITENNARCRFELPIKNNGYVIVVTDSEKYNVAVFGLVDNIIRSYLTSPNTLNRASGYLCAASTSPTYAPSMTANGAYIYAAFKKMDGTDFTEDEITNAVGTIFVIGKQTSVYSWGGVERPNVAQKWVNKDAIIGIKDPAELALVNGYAIEPYYNNNNKLYGAHPNKSTAKRATSLTQVIIGNLDGKTIHFTSYTLSSGATIAFAVYYLYIDPSTGSFDASQYVELGDNNEFVYMAWNETDITLPVNNVKIGVRALMVAFKITNADRDFTAAELREIPTLFKIR